MTRRAWLALGIAVFGIVVAACLPAHGQLVDTPRFVPPSEPATTAEAPPWSPESALVPDLPPARPRLPGWHTAPDDPERHVGRGEPLFGTSWLNRPWHFGWLFGGLFGDELIGGRVNQGDDYLGGYRLGCDFDHFYGLEGRFAFANVDLSSGGVSLDHTSRDWFWDVSLLYYPWGDSACRPFWSIGLGAANFRFLDELDQRVNETLVAVPLGCGLKYQLKKWLAVRTTLTDNLAFGGAGLEAMHNVSLTFDVEWHFGSRQVSYYPWNASKHLW